MDQSALRQTADEITIANLRSLLNVQTDLRDQSERRAHDAVIAFQDLLQTLAPEESERLQRSGTSIESLPFGQLADILRAKSRQLVSDLARLQRPQIENAEAIISKAYTQNTLLRGELKRVKEALEGVQAENIRFRSENEVLKKARGKKPENESEVRPARSSPGATAPVISSAKGDGEPAWMGEWRKSKHFEYDSQAILLLGRTGLSRRPEMAEELGKLINVDGNSGTHARIIKRLVEELGMVSVEKPFQSRGASSGGSNPDIIQLTDRGKLAYRLLSGAEPVPGEFERLQPAHVSPEHTLLNIEVADFLQKEGYKILTEALAIDLPLGGKFIPDLVAEKEDDVFFIEVERGVSKDTRARQTKWLNFQAASGGRIYVFCDNLECMCGIRKELIDALGPHQASFSLTNLAQLKNGDRGKDGSIWLDRRKGLGPQARLEPG
jgi:hypothetical protein